MNGALEGAMNRTYCTPGPPYRTVHKGIWLSTGDLNTKARVSANVWVPVNQVTVKKAV